MIEYKCRPVSVLAAKFPRDLKQILNHIDLSLMAGLLTKVQISTANFNPRKDKEDISIHLTLNGQDLFLLEDHWLICRDGAYSTVSNDDFKREFSEIDDVIRPYRQ